MDSSRLRFIGPGKFTGTRFRRCLLAAMTGGVLLCTSSCLPSGGDSDSRAVAESRLERRTVELGNASAVRAHIHQGAGDLRVSGGASDLLMDAAFRCNLDSWKPTVRYSESDTRGTLEITQPSGQKTWGRTVNSWVIQLNEKVPLDLDVNLGAGESQLHLGSLNLRSVKVALGAGKVQMDLLGNLRHSFDVDVSGGVGQAEIRVPRDGVGIRATAHGGIGSINVQGLRKNGDEWVNDTWDEAKVRVRLDVSGGIGEIVIRAE